ncbi:MAG: riboflavin synthase [Cyanobacteria bacterium P01_H01_bin.119]
MFTGLIQALGSLTPLGDTQLKIICHPQSDRPPEATIAHPILNDMALGDSIAVNGVCLTVESKLPQGFIATASPETLKRSNLGQLAPGATVNLEASLRVGSKIGGHFVTGHVDGIGYLESSDASDSAWTMVFKVPDGRVARYIVPKGSIAVNGISLTVANCSTGGDWFSVAVIPVTYADTNLGQLTPGQGVNLEGDVLGKYAEKFLQTGSLAHAEGNGHGPAQDLSLGFLAEHGYS